MQKNTAGETLFAKLTEQYDFSVAELAQVERLCATRDVIEALEADIAEHGTLRNGRLAPAVRELRQQNLAFMRLIGALNLPADAEESATPKHYVRTGTRGPYKLVG